MRFAYALLGLVTLTSIHTSSGQQCSNGLAGFEQDDVCCHPACGGCGGRTCDQLLGGAENCCTSRIRDSGVMCSATQPAPCIVENESMCDNGVPGIQSGDICCDTSCGTCGGGGCSARPGGSDSCCTGQIRDAGLRCETTLASPCIIETDSMCDNGLPGIQQGDICCDASCGTCGGSGCAKRPGGSASCCTGRIMDSGMMCDTTMASPCIVNDSTLAPTSPPTSEPTAEATAEATSEPTAEATAEPTSEATAEPTSEATAEPTSEATAEPTSEATAEPTSEATAEATAEPSAETTSEPTAEATSEATEVPAAVCSNGFPGVQTNTICCEAQCGICGGPGCGLRPGGEAGCCSTQILTTGMACSIALAAPCFIDV